MPILNNSSAKKIKRPFAYSKESIFPRTRSRHLSADHSPIFSLVERNDSSYIYIVSHTIGPILPLERHWWTSPHEQMTTRQTPKRENFKLIRRYPWSPSLRCEKWNVSMRKDSRLPPARAVYKCWITNCTKLFELEIRPSIHDHDSTEFKWKCRSGRGVIMSTKRFASTTCRPANSRRDRPFFGTTLSRDHSRSLHW